MLTLPRRVFTRRFRHVLNAAPMFQFNACFIFSEAVVISTILFATQMDHFVWFLDPNHFRSLRFLADLLSFEELIVGSPKVSFWIIQGSFQGFRGLSLQALQNEILQNQHRSLLQSS